MTKRTTAWSLMAVASVLLLGSLASAERMRKSSPVPDRVGTSCRHSFRSTIPRRLRIGTSMAFTLSMR